MYQNLGREPSYRPRLCLKVVVAMGHALEPAVVLAEVVGSLTVDHGRWHRLVHRGVESVEAVREEAGEGKGEDLGDFGGIELGL